MESNNISKSARSNVSQENLRILENEDNDNVWNRYKKLKTIDKKPFSDVYLIRRLKSKKHWKKWRKDYDLAKCSSCTSLDKLEADFVADENSRNGYNLSSLNMFQFFSKKRDKSQDRFYALKMIKLFRFSNPKSIEMLRKEIAVMKTLDHPYIVKAFETYEIPQTKLYIVMELLTGGDLWSRAPYTEKDAARVMGQLMSAVTYMHDHGIFHRDLKLENVMFETEAPDSDIKVIDFGLSVKFTLDDKRPWTTRVGTAYAMSPGVIKRQYSEKADSWACGVIAFALIANKAPFVSEKPEQLKRVINEGKFEFIPTNIWDDISKHAKDFISELLEYDSARRLDPCQALNHVWIKTQYPLEARKPSSELMTETTMNLLKSNNCGLLRSLALYIIASRARPEEVDKYRKVFDQYDSLNNGTISYSEFKSVLEKEYDFTEEEIRRKFEKLAFTSDKLIYYTDFLAALLDSQDYIDEEKLADAFDALDWDDTGFISIANLRHFLDVGSNDDKKLQEMLEQGDSDGDGLLTFADFLNMFRSDKDLPK